MCCSLVIQAVVASLTDKCTILSTESMCIPDTYTTAKIQDWNISILTTLGCTCTSSTLSWPSCPRFFPKVRTSLQVATAVWYRPAPILITYRIQPAKKTIATCAIHGLFITQSQWIEIWNTSIIQRNSDYRLTPFTDGNTVRLIVLLHEKFARQTANWEQVKLCEISSKINKGSKQFTGCCVLWWMEVL